MENTTELRHESFDDIYSLKLKLESLGELTELEFRQPIPAPTDFYPGQEYTVTYYYCTQYPHLTFRRKDKKLLETKELVHSLSSINDIPVNLVLSVERSYVDNELKLPLSRMSSHKLARYTEKMPDESGQLEITRIESSSSSVQWSLEIEIYKENGLPLALECLDRYKIANIAWPCPKPISLPTNELIHTLRQQTTTKKWYLSHKADGIHVLVFQHRIYNNSIYLLHDTGSFVPFTSDTNTPILTISSNHTDQYNIYEGELIDDTYLWVFDCLCYNGISFLPRVSSKTIRKNIVLPDHEFLHRRDLIPSSFYWSIKPVLELDFSRYPDPLVVSFMYTPSPFKNDGYILTHQFSFSHVYKSKFQPTTDMLYIDGKLFLAHEKRSLRLAPFQGENNTIYEVHSLTYHKIRARHDKTAPNAKLDLACNPLLELASRNMLKSYY